MEVNVRNLSGREIDVEDLRAVVEMVLAAEAAELSALSVALVDDTRIAHLNRRLLGRIGPTDVIAFEAEAGEGEVIISVDTAERQAQEFGHSLRDELRYLMAHGVLHVLGWDDSTAELRCAMLRRQDAILSQD